MAMDTSHRRQAAGRLHRRNSRRGTALTSIELKVEGSRGQSRHRRAGTVTLSDGTEIVVMTDGKGEVTSPTFHPAVHLQAG